MAGAEERTGIENLKVLIRKTLKKILIANRMILDLLRKNQVVLILPQQVTHILD